ncbi:MAG: TetR/AcrR family transcriptional regulator [Paracoccaceae bacterium]
MARPRTHSDDDILSAAQTVLLRQGPGGFTLSDAATEVGMSRPALIQRFGNRESLMQAIATREVEQTRDWLASLPGGRGIAPLWSFLKAAVRSMGPGQGAQFDARIALAAVEASDPHLAASGAERHRMVQQAIAERLPEGTRDPMGLSLAIHGLMAGAVLQWLVTRDTPLRDVVLVRLGDLMGRLWPDITFPL